MRWIALLLGAVLAATYASPAIGGPDLAGKLSRVDKREKAHYRELDRRIKATVLLAQSDRLNNNIVSQSMTQDGRFFSGSASCGYGQTLTGGGVDWGVSLVAQGWHVISSAPSIGGSTWSASVAATDSVQGPSVFPKVYAVCAVVR